MSFATVQRHAVGLDGLSSAECDVRLDSRRHVRPARPLLTADGQRLLSEQPGAVALEGGVGEPRLRRARLRLVGLAGSCRRRKRRGRDDVDVPFLLEVLAWLSSGRTARRRRRRCAGR
ncbi:MAG: hypothetical protein ACRD0K_27975 [Egibacteraceae bacterium]